MTRMDDLPNTQFPTRYFQPTMWLGACAWGEISAGWLVRTSCERWSSTKFTPGANIRVTFLSFSKNRQQGTPPLPSPWHVDTTKSRQVLPLQTVGDFVLESAWSIRLPFSQLLLQPIGSNSTENLQQQRASRQPSIKQIPRTKAPTIENDRTILELAYETLSLTKSFIPTYRQRGAMKKISQTEPTTETSAQLSYCTKPYPSPNPSNVILIPTYKDRLQNNYIHQSIKKSYLLLLAVSRWAHGGHNRLTDSENS